VAVPGRNQALFCLVQRNELTVLIKTLGLPLHCMPASALFIASRSSYVHEIALPWDITWSTHVGP